MPFKFLDNGIGLTEDTLCHGFPLDADIGTINNGYLLLGNFTPDG
ncbi:hypothetical protein GPROT1_02459 [Gammaproteobacteria bacterium]|nr:hypothetical protein GPROT1_02459 [Gammaproteobacteria bacterium]